MRKKICNIIDNPFHLLGNVFKGNDSEYISQNAKSLRDYIERLTPIKLVFAAHPCSEKPVGKRLCI